MNAIQVREIIQIRILKKRSESIEFEACSGDSTEICGGQSKNSVYETGVKVISIDIKNE